ncbi:3-oxoacyl-ACP synthase [Streptomyces sp. IMTB 2501]|uniref:3-oxoacyl-ACP synthase III family protein n=1 Tax=Streptomyces sp. IMTB 2501 TaxID=1776340 RepID=UPI00096CD9B7|nr:ketoacyl-ACP synthase III [Streptomyces sp. IMTB 2501]OLZ61281.1 3-oxoacyl-ACP synthase [Streptomyces sp. IMTB 2501]
MSIGIVGTGSYLPEAVVTNEEIAGPAGVTAQWITDKTGVRERRRAAGSEATSDLAARAGAQALAQAGIQPEQVAYVVVATSTPDHPQPATASIVQDLLGARNAAAFDVNAVCAGFTFALSVGEGLLRRGTNEIAPYALIIGADIYSRILDYTDRRTCILFGDGAGAVVLGPVAPALGLIDTQLTTRGDAHDLIKVPAGGSRHPASYETLRAGGHFFTMNGRGVRQFVHDELPGIIATLLYRSGTPLASVRHLVPHQANGVMLADLWPDLGLVNAELHLALQRHGNTGAASVPITLDHANRAGKLREGETVVLTAFGGGMSVGTTVLRWAATAARARTSGAELTGASA